MKQATFVLAIATSLFAAKPNAVGSTEDPPPVRTATVTSSGGSLGKAFVGSIEPARRSVVGTAVAGRLERVFVETGDYVEQSGELGQLRLKNVQIRLAAAQADLEVSQHELAELTQGPRQEDLQRLAARVKGADALRTFATKNFQRLESLLRRGATPRGDLDQALSTMQAAEQEHIAATAEHDAAIAGTRKEQLAQAKAKVTKSEEEVNRIQDELDEHTIRAPFAGYVVKRNAEHGEWLFVGSPIAEIVELDPAEIRVAVPEEYITYLKPGQTVRVDVAAVMTPGVARPPWVGTIFRIVPDADARSRSFPVRIRIDNPIQTELPLLQPGMSAKVFLPVDSQARTLLVPQDALVLDRNRTFVFVVDNVDARSIVRRVEVSAGATQDAMIRVKSLSGRGISFGSEIVIEGNESLESGQVVNVVGRTAVDR